MSVSRADDFRRIRAAPVGVRLGIAGLWRRKRPRPYSVGSFGIAPQDPRCPRANRVKRLIREAFRLNKAQMPPGIDLVVLPRGHVARYDAVAQSLVALSRDVARR